jgi:glycine cleavage system H protein
MMSIIHGCDLPDDLYYQIEKHVWAKLLDDGNVRVGITSVAAKLSGGDLAAVTVRSKKIGTEVMTGKSLATIESSKFVGPVPAPITGVLLRANDKVTEKPNLAVSDPYGDGWIVELQPSNWDAEKNALVTGQDGISAYKAKMESDGISCE